VNLTVVLFTFFTFVLSGKHATSAATFIENKFSFLHFGAASKNFA